MNGGLIPKPDEDYMMVLLCPGEVWVTRECYERYGVDFLRSLNGSEQSKIYVGADREQVA